MKKISLLSLAALAAANSTLPRPTLPQLKYAKGEIMALVHFNMATFFHKVWGSAKCVGDSSIVSPVVAIVFYLFCCSEYYESKTC